MSTITLTPKEVEPFYLLGKKATVTISKSMISFSASTAHRLALKKGSKFTLEIENGKLFYKDSADENSFAVKNETRQGGLNAYAKGILPAIAKYLNLNSDTQKFELGLFKEGKWELVAVNNAKKEV